MLKDILEIQPDREELHHRRQDTAGKRKRMPESRGPVMENPMVRQAIRVGGKILPYLGWLIPLADRLIPKRDSVAAGMRNFGIELRNDLRNDLRKDLREHMLAIQAAQVDVSPAIEEQQRRLEKLEEHASELNHSLTNLSEDQLDLADQVRAMAGWVRNGAIAGLFLLVLLFILKLVQAVHGMWH